MVIDRDNTSAPQYVVIWEFLIKPEAQAEFERIYGVTGDWSALFRQSENYRGTKLIQDLNRPERYLTLDHWTSKDEYEKFKEIHKTAYEEIDRRCESLTLHETLIGEFEMAKSMSAK